MSRRSRNLALLMVGAFIFALLLFKLSASGSGHRAVDVRTPVRSGTSSVPATFGLQTPSPGPSAASSGKLKSYAVDLSDLQGLSPDTAPGTHMDLWVAWEPPITRGPKIQRLLHGVTLEKMIPPVVPDGPVTALLSVRASQIPRLLYGDRYGALSATIRAP
jgi:hypothetical protein